MILGNLEEETFGGGRVQNIDGEIIYSPSDITSWVKCQWGYVRKLDSKLGKGNIIPPDNDPMMLYSARNGLRHEEYVLTEFQQKYGSKKVFILTDEGIPGDTPRLEKLRLMDKRTSNALEQRWPVVFQASFFDGKYTGFADFLEWTEIDGVWAYEVLDTKLALSDKNHVYDRQLSFYARQLKRLGIPVHNRVRLIHGDLSESEFWVPEVISGLEHHLEKLEKIEQDRRKDPDPLSWLSSDYSVCGKCASCAEQIDLDSGDLLRVSGLGPAKRNILVETGILRIPELANLDKVLITGIPENTLDKLIAQANRQWVAVETGDPQIRVEYRNGFESLPAPDTGDLYFDFETDPIFYVEGSKRLGIAYLFGIYTQLQREFTGFSTSDDGRFNFLWADSREEEKEALNVFMRELIVHLTTYPMAHIYHYSPFEITTLKQLTSHYQIYEEELASLISSGRFYDLKTAVTKAVSHGLEGYSIKQLEPLYMGKELRTGTKKATASITRYDDYHRTLNAEVLELGESADEIRDDVLQYNRYDCYSMFKLRIWLDECLAVQREKTWLWDNEISPK